MLSINVSYYSKEFLLTSPEALYASLEWNSKVAIESFALLFFIVAVILNSIVIASFVYCRRPLDVIEALVINMAIGDILSSFTFPLPLAVQLLQGGQQIYDGGCKLLAWLGVVSVSLTSITLVAIAYCVKCKTKSRFLPGYHDSMFWLGIFILWVVPAFEGLPYLATVDWKAGDCTPSWDHGAQTAYVVALLLLQTVLPLGILTRMTVSSGIENYRIRYAARQQADVSGDACQLEDDSERYASQQHLKMVNLLAAAFFIIMIPYTFFHLWLALNIDEILPSPRIGHAYIIFHMLLCMKPLASPIVYFTVWETLKNNVLEMLFKCCRRRKAEFRSVKYTMTVRSNGHDCTRNHEDGETLILGGEMPIIEEVRGVELNSDVNKSDDKLFTRGSSSDYDFESDDVYRDDVAIL